MPIGSRGIPHAAGLALALLAATPTPLSIGAPAATAASKVREVIGRSVQGRPLLAWRTPDRGEATVLVFGCVHGDETAGRRVARRLLASRAPRQAALWVVPSINPDGERAGTRGNARGVDLNRNFPYAWRPLGGLEYSGRRPLSEPESRAAARLIRRLRPDLTIWFHQPFGIVARSGGAPAVERRYARLAGLPYSRLYRPPGSASSWQNHAFRESSAFVVELPARVPRSLARRAGRAVVRLADEYGSAAVDRARELGSLRLAGADGEGADARRGALSGRRPGAEPRARRAAGDGRRSQPDSGRQGSRAPPRARATAG